MTSQEQVRPTEWWNDTQLGDAGLTIDVHPPIPKPFAKRLSTILVIGISVLFIEVIIGPGGLPPIARVDFWLPFSVVILLLVLLVFILLLRTSMYSGTFSISPSGIVPTKYGRRITHKDRIAYDEIEESVLRIGKGPEEPPPFEWRLRTKRHGLCFVNGVQVWGAADTDEIRRQIVRAIKVVDSRLKSA